MENLIQEIEAFKSKIANANQLTEETTKLNKQLSEVIEQIKSLKRTGEELEEKYQQISQANELKFIELAEQIKLNFEDWSLSAHTQFVQNKKALDSFIDEYRASLKKQQTFTYITWALIVVGVVGVILVK
jgi:predicted nuclease with TOPRIM domain